MSKLASVILRKFDKLTREQAREFFADTLEEIQRLEAVLDSIHTGVAVCDSDHNLILINKTAKRLIGVRGKGSRPVWLAVRDEDIASFIKKTLRSKDKVEGREFTSEEGGGRIRILNFNILPLVKLRSVIGSLIVVEDITEKRAAEVQMRRAESLAGLTTFAAGVAHDIKNPLASISIHIQLVRKLIGQAQGGEFNFEKIFGHIDTVNEEIERLNDIVVDFLFAVRPMNLTLLKSDINALLESVVKLMEPELINRGIKYSLELSPLPLVEFDKRYMKEAMLNIIKNAIEAMTEGGILYIRTESLDADIVISITDTGEGMSEETQSKIFGPYFTTKDTGTGLGLTSVFKIIREHNGEISVNSKSGEGSTFCITLPIPITRKILLSYNGNYKHEIQNTDS